MTFSDAVGTGLILNLEKGMKIINPGKLPDPNRLLRGICSNCGCQVECRLSESIWTEFHTAGRDFGKLERAVKCPTEECPYQIFLQPVDSLGQIKAAKRGVF